MYKCALKMLMFIMIIECLLVIGAEVKRLEERVSSTVIDKQTYMDALGEINLRKEWSVGQIFLSYLLWNGEKIGSAQTSRIQWRTGSYAAGASATLAEIRAAIMGGRDAGTVPDKS